MTHECFRTSDWGVRHPSELRCAEIAADPGDVEMADISWSDSVPCPYPSGQRGLSGKTTAVRKAVFGIALATSVALSGCSGSSGKSTPPTKSGSATSGASATGFCANVWKITFNLAALDTDAIEGGTNAPSASTWRSAAAAAQSLIGDAPTTQVGVSTVRDDVTTMSGDLQDILANGYDTSNGGANLQGDVGVVQADAQRLGCPQS